MQIVHCPFTLMCSLGLSNFSVATCPLMCGLAWCSYCCYLLPGCVSAAGVHCRDMASSCQNLKSTVPNRQRTC